MSRILLSRSLGFHIEIASITDDRLTVLESIQQQQHLSLGEMRRGFGEDLLKLTVRLQAIQGSS
ncbi:hypothetical protein BN844_4351 [Pseudomonas sp. SHC52]|nr:hypothetical protein BN844_4351 [Pseudomonas sp. SHC52]